MRAKKVKTKSKPRKKTESSKDLAVFCLLCKSNFTVKYQIRQKRYSLFNNWSYLTDRQDQEQEWMCNSCLMKLHYGSMSDWIINKKKAIWFYNNVSRRKYENN